MIPPACRPAELLDTAGPCDTRPSPSASAAWPKGLCRLASGGFRVSQAPLTLAASLRFPASKAWNAKCVPGLPFSRRHAAVSRIVLIWVFPAKRVRSLAWGTGAVTMAVWITNAQATGATVTARAGQTRTNHPTAGAQPLQMCAPKTAMHAIATAETGRPLVKVSRRHAAFRATSTRKPTSTKSTASCSMPASRRLPWRSSPSARRSRTCRCFPATCTPAWATWGSTWSKPT